MTAAAEQNRTRVLTQSTEGRIDQMCTPGTVYLYPDLCTEQAMWLSHRVYSLQGIIAATKTSQGVGMERAINAIGAYGKQRVDEFMRLRAMFFAEEAPMLKLFANDPRKYAFAFQMDQLRLAQLNMQRAHEAARQGAAAIIDRCPWGNRAFALSQYLLGNLNEQELSLYYDELRRFGPYQVSYIILLWVSPAEAYQRMKRRGRPEENGVTVEYLDLLDRVHLVLALKEIKNHTSRILLVDCDQFLDPRVLITRLAEHRTQQDYKIEGEPLDVFYLSVDERRKIVTALLSESRVATIPSNCRPAKRPPRPAIEDFEAAGT